MRAIELCATRARLLPERRHHPARARARSTLAARHRARRFRRLRELPDPRQSNEEYAARAPPGCLGPRRSGHPRPESSRPEPSEPVLFTTRSLPPHARAGTTSGRSGSERPGELSPCTARAGFFLQMGPSGDIPIRPRPPRPGRSSREERRPRRGGATRGAHASRRHSCFDCCNLAQREPGNLRASGPAVVQPTSGAATWRGARSARTPRTSLTPTLRRREPLLRAPFRDHLCDAGRRGRQRARPRRPTGFAGRRPCRSRRGPLSSPAALSLQPPLPLQLAVPGTRPELSAPSEWRACDPTSSRRWAAGASGSSAGSLSASRPGRDHRSRAGRDMAVSSRRTARDGPAPHRRAPGA